MAFITVHRLSCLSLGLVLTACGSGGGGPAAQTTTDSTGASDAGTSASSNADASQPTSAPTSETSSSPDPTSTWEEPTSTEAIPYEDGATAPSVLIINEVMASNDGAWIDGVGEAEDWLELVNTTTGSLQLEEFTLEDSSGEALKLPEVTLRGGHRIILWLDDQVEQGTTHLPFKLSADGDELTLRNLAGEVLDTVTYEDAVTNESLMRLPDVVGELTRCRYATPGTPNGEDCAPPAPPDIESSVTYQPFEFPEPFPPAGGPLVISELALNPAAFVEILNVSSASESLSNYALRSSAHGPGLAWPTQTEGTLIPLPDVSLEPGERTLVELDAAHVEDIAADPAFEGVVTLFDTRSLAAVERVDFMRWPEDAVLTRVPDANGLFRFCTNQTPGEANTCDVLPSRDVGDRIRYLRTPGDYEALANGETQLGIQGVKFIWDMKSGGVVHLLSTEKWALHYTFIREQIYGDPPLDRCDPTQRQEFDQGWYDFSEKEYFVSEGRSFILGTLTEHSGTALHTIEHAIGDAIVGEQMKDAFYAVVPHTDNPTQWALRPQDDVQAERAKLVDGQLPIVSPETPFQNVTFQPLTEGVAYGTLKFVPSDRLYSEPLGPDVIVITDDVPNDIPLVGGLITEAFQTPLAHVNVLSENRGTPNAGLRNARVVLAEHIDKLVRIEVNASGLHVGEADLEEAQAYWDSFVPAAANISPRIDETVRGVQPLSAHNLASIPMVGAKAAQLAELLRIDQPGKCSSGHTSLNLPEAPFAIPVVHSREHFAASGAQALLEELSDADSFKDDPVARAHALEQVQAQIRSFPVDAALLAEVEQAVSERWGNERIRLRSSSNTEDLPNFTGAGLYTSVAANHDDAGEIEDGIREVWASLWNPRAYDERRFAGIDPTNIAMGVLVHPAYPSEEANGVAVTRNVLDLSRGDVYYFNVQAGEAAVTNPAPGVTTEQLTYNWYRTPLLMYQSESSLLDALDEKRAAVLSGDEADELACAMSAIHDWFRPLLDPNDENPYFTMEAEFKLIGPDRQLLIKQARPHSFGSAESLGDCREL